MTYKALDGHLIESGSEPVIYISSINNLDDGVYESFETTESTNPIGIEQIKIVRNVVNGIMTITVTESTNQELQDYKDSLI